MWSDSLFSMQSITALTLEVLQQPSLPQEPAFDFD